MRSLTTLLRVFRPSFRFRDAGTGRFVSQLYTLAHPGTTVSEKAS